MPQLEVLKEGPAAAESAAASYAKHVNPEWVRLLDLLGMNVRYTRCEGTQLFAEDGRVFLDFLSGYCVHNTGHNHPKIVAFRAIHPGMFGQMLVRRLFHHHGVLSQICGNNFMVLKVAPPLVVREDQLDQYVEAIGSVVDALHTSSAFWSEALELGRRALRV
ncbi:MAG TPA: aminotransferase class III-fold pyridoxal phosphate-dependent enzyme [Acidobacteriaceae bacterium]|nr:aminotransferase class III-fold pyridoxal phosphate-dependent enzyme [Acidobacteriaceae bacterium]